MMKKKFLSVLLGLVMALSMGLLAACGGGGTKEFDFSVESIMEKYDSSLYTYDGPEVNISMAHWDAGGSAIEKAVVDTVLKGFHLRYPQIKVNLEIVPRYEESYANNIATNNLHDVFLVPDGVMAQWAGGGKMTNLDPYIAASELISVDEMMSSALDRYRYNAATNLTGSGSVLALPKDIGPQVMYYNKDVFAEMGVELPPADRIMTMDEATAMWQALTKRNSKGDITRYGVAGLGVEGLVWSAGGDFLNDSRSAFPTEQSDLDALKKAYGFIQKSYLETEICPPATFSAGMNPTTLFSMQRSACLFSGRWEVASFRELTFDWDIAHIPSFPENPTKNYWSGSVGYAMKTGMESAKKQAAWKVIEYIASKEGQEILTATGFQIPVYTQLGLSEELVNREKELGPHNYEIFIEAAANQPSGLWQYRSSQKWKTMGYDLTSEKLFDEKNPMSIDEFINKARVAVNSNLS